MSARFRSTGSVYRFIETRDDVGGVERQRALIYDSIPIQISAQMPNSALLQQGIETRAVFLASVHSRRRGEIISIEEEDEIDINSAFLSGTFRVVGVQTPVIRNGTSIHLTLQKTRTSRRKSF